MFKKIIVGIGSVVLFAVMVWCWYFFVYAKKQAEHTAAVEKVRAAVAAAEKKVVEPGTYAIVQSESTLRWSASKSLVPNFTAAGLFNLKEGTIEVGEGSASGTFVVNMNTLQVGRVGEGGKESELQTVLKGPLFFDVAHYPDALFVITEIVPFANNATSFLYRMRGDLTLKGATHEIVFTAKIYAMEDVVHAEAGFDLDRTLWGITASSSSVGAIGESIVGDSIPLILSVVARKQ